MHTMQESRLVRRVKGPLLWKEGRIEVFFIFISGTESSCATMSKADTYKKDGGSADAPQKKKKAKGKRTMVFH